MMYIECSCCRRLTPANLLVDVYGLTGKIERVCFSCLDTYFHTCKNCLDYISLSENLCPVCLLKSRKEG